MAWNLKRMFVLSPGMTGDNRAQGRPRCRRGLRQVDGDGFEDGIIVPTVTSIPSGGEPALKRSPENPSPTGC